MRHVSLILFLGLFLFSTLASATQQGGVIDSRWNQMEEKIRTEWQNYSGMPGLQIRVTELEAEGEKTVFEYTGGFRAVGQPERVTSHDQWHLGSCTKPMTAFLIGRLVDEGSIKWTTTLAEIASKDYPLSPTIGAITIEQLLAHASGLAEVMSPDDGKLWETLYTDQVEPQVMRDKLVKGILKSPLRFKPGEKTEYSNSSYVVLGWILEQKKGDSWEHVIQQELFDTLGMTSCGFGPAGLESKMVATQPWSHLLLDQKLVAIAPGLQADNPPALGPAGTVHCTVGDWQKFLKLFIDNQVDHKGIRSGFLSQSSYDKLLSHAGKEHTFATFGRKEHSWANGTVFSMTGSNTYNLAVVAIAPSLKRIYTVNTNAGHAQAEETAKKILKMITDP